MTLIHPNLKSPQGTEGKAEREGWFLNTTGPLETDAGLVRGPHIFLFSYWRALLLMMWRGLFWEVVSRYYWGWGWGWGGCGCVCVCVCVCARTCVLSHVWLFVTPWTVAHRAPLPMGFPRQESWSELLLPSPGNLPDPGIKPLSLVSPALAGGFFTTAPPGSLTSY